MSKLRGLKKVWRMAIYGSRHGWYVLTWKDNGCYKVMKIRLNKTCRQCGAKL